MVTLNEIPKEVKIKYPCNWNYKIITPKEEELRKEIKDLLEKRICKLKKGKKSSKGKYTSLNLEILVYNDDDRKLLFEELKKMKAVKMVL